MRLHLSTAVVAVALASTGAWKYVRRVVKELP